MKILPRFLYFFCFIGMAVAAVLALDRALQPSMSAILLRAVIVAAFCGAAGLVYRKAWAVSLVLLPVGAYLLLRTIIPPSSSVEGIGGLYHFYVEQLAVGATQYATKFFPLNLVGAPELRLLLAFAVYCLTGIASFLALSLRKPIPGVALVLALLGFSFTVDTVPRVLGLALLFLVLAVCLLILSRSLERRIWRLRDAIPGVAVGVAGSLLAVVLLAAAPSAVANPWQDWRTWNPFNQGSYIYSFNWLQNYPQLLNPANNVVIMKVESSSPSYWRANALDSFTGEAWVASQSFFQDVGRVRQATTYVYSIPAADPSPPGQAVTEHFQVHWVSTNYFFTGGDPRSLTFDEDVSVRMNDMRSLHVVNPLGPSLDYTISAVIPKITPSSLVGLGSDYPDAIRHYLELPFPRVDEIEGADKDAAWRRTVPDAAPEGWQWTDLYSLNQKIIEEATDPYDIALHLERYLRSTYDYSLEPPTSDYPSPYAAFLFDTHAGYCQHFAGVMAMLLRFNGIPARVAVGFATGDLESPGVYSVSTNNAHAWVEAYFPTAGWVAFDPTPGRNLPDGGASSTSPGFQDPFASTPAGASTAVTDTPPTDFPDRQGAGGPAGQASGPSWISTVPWLPWVIGLVVLLAAWPFVKKWWGERGLRKGTLSQRFSASLRLLRNSLSSHGVAATSSRTIEEVLDIIESRLGLSRDPVLAARAGAVLFGGRHATNEDVQRAEAFRREVELRLRKRRGRIKTVLAWYGLPYPVRRRRTPPAPYEVPDLTLTS
jgi:transglutaminase-like putative cysteine protease